MAASSRSGKRRSGNGIGCLIWLGLLILVALLFALNWGKMNQVLKDTRFFDILRDRARPTASVSPRPTPRPAASAQSVVPASPKASAGAPRASERPSPRPSASVQPSRAPKATASQAPAATATPARMRAATLCLVRVDDDGTIVLRELRRNLPASDSPLLDSLTALMAGPNQDELSKGLISLIPQGSKVLSVTMRGTTALVNMNEAFMFNSLGVDGYAGQLKQMVWTCTAFPTVHDVQFLIEGRKLDYLGGDSVFIGLPLARNSW